MGNIISNSDITNWGSASDAEKTSRISRAESVIERGTKDYFYSKSFDIYRDGNRKNVLYLGLMPDILTVTAISIHGVELSEDVYTNDADRVYRSPATSPPRDSMFEHGTALFPSGTANIQIVGTYGWTTTPEEIKRCAIIIVENINNPTMHGRMMQGSENIDGYSYDNMQKAWTGLKEADDIIGQYIRKKIGIGS